MVANDWLSQDVELKAWCQKDAIVCAVYERYANDPGVTVTEFWRLLALELAQAKKSVTDICMELIQRNAAPSYVITLPSEDKELVAKVRPSVLDKEDLIRMIVGSTPSSKAIDVIEKKRYGVYRGGFLDRWEWSESALRELTEQELWDFYQQYKKTL